MITHLKDRFGSDELKALLLSMIDDMSWRSLQKILEAKAKYLQNFQVGGFRLKPQNAWRARDIILKFSEETDYEGLFLCWCMDKNDYKPIIDSWLYLKQAIEETNKDTTVEKNVVWSEELFEKLIGCTNDQHGLYFLCFSPIFFKEEEESRLLNSAERETNEKDTAEEISKTGDVKFDNLQSKFIQLKKEKKGIERDNKHCLKNSALQEKELKRLKDKLGNYETIYREYEERIAKLENIENERIDQLELIIEHLKGDSKEAKTEIKALEAKLKEKDLALERIQVERDSIREEFSKRVIEVLDQLNSPEIIRALNEPDEVKDLLLSVIKIPSGDDTLPDRLKGDELKEFWLNLIQSETETLIMISDLNMQVVSESAFSINWPDLADQLVDTKYSLRARAALLDFIYEILRNFYDSEKYVDEQAAQLTATVTDSVTKGDSVFDRNIKTLNLDHETLARLKRNNIHTIRALVTMRDNDLFRIKNFGQSHLNSVKAALEAKGLKLGMKFPDCK